MNKNKQAGGVSALLLIIVLLLMVAAGATYFMPKGENSVPGATTEEPESSQAESQQAQQPAEKAEAKSLPESYPAADAPVYEPSTIEMATGMGANSWFISVLTADDIATVAQTIVSNYEALGAEITQTPLNDDGVGQTVASLGGYGTIITYSTDTDLEQTSISYTVSKQR